MYSAMHFVPFALRAVLTSDVDVRRLYWLLRYVSLTPSHRAQLLTIRSRAARGGAWAKRGDRETIRVFFNLHRNKPVRVT